MPEPRPCRLDGPRWRGGFTLVELLAVIVVLAVLAGVAAPRYFDLRDRAQRSAAAGARAALQEAVLGWRLNTAATGAAAWPPNLTVVLAGREGERLLNPYRLPSQPVFLLDPDRNAGKWHPIHKTIEVRAAQGSGLSGSIWYNASNGAVRFTVPTQASAADTLALYNDVNRTRAASLSDTSAR